MRRILIILLLAVVFTSCEDKIVVEVPNGVTKLVVDGFLTSASDTQSLRLSTTSPYFESDPAPTVSAKAVYVTTNTGNQYDFAESPSGSGLYKANFSLPDDSSIKYVLNIDYNGKLYRSYEEKLNRVPQIDSFKQSDETIKSDGGPNGEGEFYVGLLSTFEPKGPGDYYRWIIFVNGIQRISPFDLIIADDRLVDGNPIYDWDIVYELYPDDFVEIHQMAISERAFHYWGLVFSQITQFGGPFDTPPAPIEGNMYNVADPDEQVLGFFGVNNVDKASFVVKAK